MWYLSSSLWSARGLSRELHHVEAQAQPDLGAPVRQPLGGQGLHGCDVHRPCHALALVRLQARFEQKRLSELCPSETMGMGNCIVQRIGRSAELKMQQHGQREQDNRAATALWAHDDFPLRAVLSARRCVRLVH